ncbi:uncharacterized protein MYCFIDRAFT_80455 [Pseudocercospora fijiensis CIRAD86]|uniref:Uncharacterized protein n=1 Tax=Pseudocercospora fijiensis (strain CIRAD86) TaxID=383855 RepID=M3B0C0_PSEFD|nr:uncharacterized protein MYCFIDRAFT_80455 [Pseudocercospora fijiensis CIRAD86]EME82863.1 hypothetical protein MYCFIDRAFT_80455 [Pseudocercospora fijiensis CIRAD86]
MDQSEKTEAEQKALSAQCSMIRCRIRNIVTSAISGDLHMMPKPYKPVKIRDANDATWKELSQEHDILVKKIGEMRKTTEVKKRNDVIRALRIQYPKVAKKFPEPQDPVEKPAPAPVEKSASAEKSPLPRSTFTEPPPSYDSACTVPSASRAAQPHGLPSNSIFKQTSSSPSLMGPPPVPTNNLKRPAPGLWPSQLGKGIKQEQPIDLDSDADDNSLEPEDPAEDDEYNPSTEAPKSRKERVENRATKRVRFEDFTSKLKRAISKPALEYERQQLKFKYELQDIAIKKKIADLEGDKARVLGLDMEASNIQFEKSKAEFAKKMEDLKYGEGQGGQRE